MSTYSLFVHFMKGSFVRCPASTNCYRPCASKILFALIVRLSWSPATLIWCPSLEEAHVGTVPIAMANCSHRHYSTAFLPLRASSSPGSHTRCWSCWSSLSFTPCRSGYGCCLLPAFCSFPLPCQSCVIIGFSNFWPRQSETQTAATHKNIERVLIQKGNYWWDEKRRWKESSKKEGKN